ncbi:MAG: hypothetical protein WDO13_13185 [Verrucomicrobiota bacterium]
MGPTWNSTAAPPSSRTARSTSPTRARRARTPPADPKRGRRRRRHQLGFTWPSFDAIAGDRDKTYAPELVEPALAADFFWTGYRYKAQGSGSTTTNGGITASYDGDLKSDVNTYTFCVEPLFRFNLGAFRPYVGFGFGGTYIDGGHAHLDGNIQVAVLAGRRRHQPHGLIQRYRLHGGGSGRLRVLRRPALGADLRLQVRLAARSHGPRLGLRLGGEVRSRRLGLARLHRRVQLLLLAWWISWE